MGYINRFFKYEPEQYVHTYAPVPVDTYMKLAALQEDRANRAAEYQGKFDEYLSSIKAAPGHEEWRDDVVGSIMNEINDLSSKYDYSDPRFMRELSRLRGRVSSNSDIKKLNESYAMYMNSWDKIIQSPHGKLHAYKMPGIIDENGNIIQNRQNYGQLNYTPYEDVDKAFTDYLNNRLPDIVKKLEQDDIEIRHKKFINPETKQEEIIPFFYNKKTNERTEIRDDKTFAPLIQNLIDEFKTQSTPWAVWVKDKGYGEEFVKDKATRISQSMFLNRSMVEDRSSWSPYNNNNKNKAGSFDIPIDTPQINNTDLSEIKVKNGKYTRQRIISHTPVSKATWVGREGTTQIQIGDVTEEEIKKSKEYPLSQSYINVVKNMLQLSLDREPTDKEINEELQKIGIVKNSYSSRYIADNDEREALTKRYFIDGTTSGYGSNLLFYDYANPYSSPKTLDQLYKNGEIKDKKGNVVEELDAGSDFTGGYPAFGVEFVDKKTNEKKKYYMVDPLWNTSALRRGQLIPQKEEFNFISQVTNLQYKDLPVSNIQITTKNGVEKIPFHVIHKDKNGNIIINYWNSNKKEFDNYEFNYDYILQNTGKDPFEVAAIKIYETLKNNTK